MYFTKYKAIMLLSWFPPSSTELCSPSLPPVTFPSYLVFGILFAIHMKLVSSVCWFLGTYHAGHSLLSLGLLYSPFWGHPFGSWAGFDLSLLLWFFFALLWNYWLELRPILCPVISWSLDLSFFMHRSTWHLWFGLRSIIALYLVKYIYKLT